MGDRPGSPTSERNREERCSAEVSRGSRLAPCEQEATGIAIDRTHTGQPYPACNYHREFVPVSLLTVERERRQRAEEEIPRLAEHWREALDGAHARAEAAEARAQRLAEALELARPYVQNSRRTYAKALDAKIGQALSEAGGVDG